MTRTKHLPPARKYQKLSFQVKETVLTTQPKCMPVNLAEEKEKFIYLGKTPQFKLQDPSKLHEAAEKAKNQIRFDLLGEAIHILEQVLREYGDGEIYLEHAFGPRINKEEATPMLLEYISENSLTESLTVHWCDNLACSAKMMWKGPMVNCNRPDLRKYSLWINGSDDNNYMRESGVRCLMDHEIGTHFFRMLNDGLQPWFSDRERFGLRRSGSFESKCTEEGLATINTVLRGRVQFLWGAAFAYYTACKSAEMTFRQLFDHVGRYTSNTNYRWKQVMRVKRGLKDPNDLGGFGNDQCYFEGAVSILRNMENIDFLLLMSGKVCYDEVDRIKRVVRKECLRYPSFMNKMGSYRRTLQKICLVNGLHQQHSVQKPPAVYLKRLDERKSGKVKDDANVNKTNENKNHRVTQSRLGKLSRSKQKGKHVESGDDNEDDKSEIERFPVSSTLLKMFQHKQEESRQREESCRVYATFETLTKQLTTLDLTLDQKIQQLRNIVKEHRWSNSEAAYKQRLLNQASCELMSEGSPINEQDMPTENKTVSKEESLSVVQPNNSMTKEEHSEDTDTCSESTNLKSQELFGNMNFNSNSCRNRYVKRQQTSLPLTAKKGENSCPSTAKKKRTMEDLTDSMINNKVENLKKKFLSDVNPHEIIFLEMPDEDDQNSVRTSGSNVLIDINNDITAELPNYFLKNSTAANADDNFKPQPDKNSNKIVPAGIKQKPNFILRNKLLAKRPSVTSSKTVKPGKFVDKNIGHETDSDSDDSSRRQKKIKKNNYAHIVSQYSQFKPVIVQKPKLDREILTADLCKPFFIQAERLLQAEKVLKKTRHHRHAVKKADAIATLRKKLIAHYK